MSNSDRSGEIDTTALSAAAEELVRSRQRSLLIVEDTAAHAAIIRRALANKQWEIEHVTRASDARRAIDTNEFRIVLLDLSLPDGDGLSVLEQIRAAHPNTPVVVVTATDQVDTSVAAMQKGAWDYVVKGDPGETAAKIEAAIERAYSKRLRDAEQRLIERTRLIEMVRSERLQAIELIVRTVCHEVNNPLSGVVALSQLLRQHDKLDGELVRLADGIVNSAQEVAEVVKKLNTITDDVVEFGGKSILQMENIAEDDAG